MNLARYFIFILFGVSHFFGEANYMFWLILIIFVSLDQIIYKLDDK